MGPMPPHSPFVQCRSCGIISDFDLGVARRNRDWARHEALQHLLYAQAKEDFARATRASDRAAYAAVHARILDQVMANCPQVYPPRVATDPGYRAHWIAFQSDHVASLAIDPVLVEGGRAVGKAVGEIMLAKWTMETLAPVFAVALKHFEDQERISMSRKPGPPPDFVSGWMRRVGISMTVQEWLPRLERPDQLALVEHFGVAREYVVPGDVKKPRCSGCGAAVDRARPECDGCKQPLNHGRGAFGCASCGAFVHLVTGIERAVCPFCKAEMRESRMLLEHRESYRQTFDFIESELSMANEEVKASPIRIDVLDGTVTRRDLPWRELCLRACYASGPDHDFFGNTDWPDAESQSETMGWVEAYTEVHLVPHRVLRRRDHPRSLEPPSAMELLKRRKEIDPEKQGRVHVVRRGPEGAGCEIWLGDEVITIALDDEADARAVRDAVTALGWATELVDPRVPTG